MSVITIGKCGAKAGSACKPKQSVSKKAMASKSKSYAGKGMAVKTKKPY